jgi:hypothetical protein
MGLFLRVVNHAANTHASPHAHRAGRAGPHTCLARYLTRAVHTHAHAEWA